MVKQAKQQTLDLIVKRPRVALIEDDGKEEVRVRLPRKTAAAVAAADPERLSAFVGRTAEEMMAALVTKWFCWEAPPCQGIYEITDHVTGKLRERWWFHGATWHKSGEREAQLPRIYHHDFAKTYAWRGLASMPPQGYAIPPYAHHMFEKREDGIIPLLTVVGLSGIGRARVSLEA